MAGTTIASYDGNFVLRDRVTETYKQPKSQRPSSLNFNQLSESFQSNSKQLDPVLNGVYDEGFDLTETENIKTPQSASPNMPVGSNLISTTSSSKVSCSTTLSDANLKAIAELTSKPCVYSLDRFYDECIPVKSRIRSFKSAISHSGNRYPLDEKSTLITRSASNHTTIRMLENILPCPPPCSLSRQTYSSSSGGCIGNLTDLSIQSDMPVGDGILSVPLSTRFPKFEQPLSYGGQMHSESASVSEADSSLQTDDLLSPNRGSEPKCNHQKLTAGADDISETDSGQSSIHSDEHQLEFPPMNFTEPVRTKRHPSKRNARKCDQRSLKQRNKEQSCFPVEPPINNCVDQIFPVKRIISEQVNLSDTTSSDSAQERVDCDLPLQADSTNHVEEHDSPSVPGQRHNSVNTGLTDEVSLVADEDFTLVTNRKVRRKQRLKSQANQSSEPRLCVSNNFQRFHSVSLGHNQRHFFNSYHTVSQTKFSSDSRHPSSRTNNHTAAPDGIHPRSARPSTLYRKTINSISNSVTLPANNFTNVSSLIHHFPGSHSSKSSAPEYVKPSQLMGSTARKLNSHGKATTFDNTTNGEATPTFSRSCSVSISAAQHKLLKDFFLVKWNSFKMQYSEA